MSTDKKYYSPKSWYDSIAQQVQRLASVSSKLTTDEMLEKLSDVQGGGTPLLQKKNITKNGTYTADEGYDGLERVTVNVAEGGAMTDLVGNADGIAPAVSRCEVVETIAADTFSSSATKGL